MLPTTLFLARFLLGFVFAVAGVAKLVDLPGSRSAVEGFGVPKRIVPFIGFALPLLEVTVAVALMLPTTAWWGSLGALALLLLFIAGMAYSMVRGKAPDCHCFGQIHSEPVGWKTVIRNAFLALVALWLIVVGGIDASALTDNPLARLSVAESVNLAIGIIVIGLLSYQIWLLREQLKGQRALMELMESARRTPLPASRLMPQLDEAPAPTGIPVGASAPPFALPDAEGRVRTLDSLLDAGLPVLLVFTNPSCAPCQALMPDLARWDREYASVVRIVLVGRAEHDDAPQGSHGVTHMLFQESSEVADAYQVPGTPAAVLVHPSGVIASPVATGGPMILALLEQFLDLAGIPRVQEIDPALVLEQIASKA